MAYQFLLLFEGLCAFADRMEAIEVFLPSGHGEHGANLIVRADFLDLERTTWKPTTVGVIYEPGIPLVPRQVAIWSLHGEDVTILAKAAATGNPKWSFKDRLLDFKTEHGGSSTLSARDIRKIDKRVAVIELKGTSDLVPTKPTSDDNFVLTKDGMSPKPVIVTRTVEWKPPADDVPVFDNGRGGLIAFNKEGGLGWGCITNSAPVDQPTGLAHFHHYYEGVKLSTGDKQIRISSAFVNVFDCVPPVAWP